MTNKTAATANPSHFFRANRLTDEDAGGRGCVCPMEGTKTGGAGADAAAVGCGGTPFGHCEGGTMMVAPRSAAGCLRSAACAEVGAPHSGQNALSSDTLAPHFKHTPLCCRTDGAAD